MDEDQYENEAGDETMHDYNEADDYNYGWPGDGSGEDDFADYNQNEADDYRDEGYEDDWLDGANDE